MSFDINKLNELADGNNKKNIEEVNIIKNCFQESAKKFINKLDSEQFEDRLQEILENVLIENNQEKFPVVISLYTDIEYHSTDPNNTDYYFDITIQLLLSSNELFNVKSNCIISTLYILKDEKGLNAQKCIDTIENEVINKLKQLKLNVKFGSNQEWDIEHTGDHDKYTDTVCYISFYK